MKIAVIGGTKLCTEKVIQTSEHIGTMIAESKDTLLFGGCGGYPYAAAQGAFLAGGEVIGISPAKDIHEHRTYYAFPTENISKLVFTGLGIPRRNYPLIEDADAVILIGGQIGSLNEFTIAFHLEKKIGVLRGSGGIAELIEDIARVCNTKRKSPKIFYSENGKELLRMLHR